MRGGGLRFLARESCDFAVVQALRAEGHDVVTVSEITQRSDDREVIQRAAREQRILLTEANGFGWLVFVSHPDSAGVILIRFPGNARRSLVRSVSRLVREHGERLRGPLWLCSLVMFASAPSRGAPRVGLTDDCRGPSGPKQLPAKPAAPAGQLHPLDSQWEGIVRMSDCPLAMGSHVRAYLSVSREDQAEPGTPGEIAMAPCNSGTPSRCTCRQRVPS